MNEIKGIPILRFSEFSENLRSTNMLNHHISSAFGPRFSSNLYSVEGNVVTLRTTDMDDNGKISYDFAPRANVNFKKIEGHLLQKNDLVISRSGTIGVTGLFSGYRLPVIPGAFLIRIRLKTDELNPKFVQYTLNSLRGRNSINKVAAGGVQKNVTSGSLLNLNLNVPSIGEQQRIASFLTAVDDKITQLTKKKALLEQYKKGILQRIFSQEIRFKPVQSEVEGNKEGKDYPDWQTKHLGEVLKIGSGRDYKHLADGAIPVFGSGGIMTKVNEFLYDGESVGIGRKGTIDRPVFLTGKFWTVDTLFYTHSFREVLPKFIYYVFKKINWYRYNEASGVPSLSKKTIEKIAVKIPCLPEQAKIANFLSAADDKITQVDNQIEKTTAFKKGCCNKCLFKLIIL